MIIIPARLKSSRFSEKILVPINGIPMCIYTALNASKVDEVVVATDSEQVCELAKEYNIKAVLTSQNHESGTERLAECVDILKLNDDEIIINLQADEPLFEEENLIKFKEFCLRFKDEFFMASCYTIKDNPSDENTVKVVLDTKQNAIYFSRAAIPFDRDKKGVSYNHHLGIYAYTAKSLKEFISLKSSLEHIEKLEQLRAIENGKIIKMCEINTKSFGIDTKADYERLLGVLNA